jgi:hypothetical protein
MPVNFQWRAKDRILHIEHVAPLTVKELEAGLNRYLAYLYAAPQPLHLIADWRQAHGYPLQFSMVSKAMAILRHRNMGYITLVGMNPSVAFWVEFFARLTRWNYRVFESVEDAAQFLEQIGQTEQVST